MIHADVDSFYCQVFSRTDSLCTAMQLVATAPAVSALSASITAHSTAAHAICPGYLRSDAWPCLWLNKGLPLKLLCCLAGGAAR